jgi:hypothetical protein
MFDGSDEGKFRKKNQKVQIIGLFFLFAALIFSLLRVILPSGFGDFLPAVVAVAIACYAVYKFR